MTNNPAKNALERLHVLKPTLWRPAREKQNCHYGKCDEHAQTADSQSDMPTGIAATIPKITTTIASGTPIWWPIYGKNLAWWTGMLNGR